MTKLAYERPLMRAEVFRTNAYAEGCRRDVDKETDYIRYFLDGITELLFNTKRETCVNMNTGEDQYYYVQNAENDAKVDGNMYFLEYSAENKNFNLYQDHDKSGYGLDVSNPFNWQSEVKGLGTLQTAGLLGYSGGWCYTDYNPSGTTNNIYRPDKVVKRNISFDEFTETTWTNSF